MFYTFFFRCMLLLLTGRASVQAASLDSWLTGEAGPALALQ